MSEDTEPRCWVVRTDRRYCQDLIGPELEEGVLRQGWGWDASQDLRVIRAAIDANPADVDDDQWEAWSHNRRLLPDGDDSIASGDLLVLPHTPVVGRWSIAQAGDDYDFRVAHTGDHGHRRGVRLLRFGLDPGLHELPASLRRTMRCQRAVWNIDHHLPTIGKLVSNEVGPRRTVEESLEYVRGAASQAAWESLRDRFGGAELEAPTRLVLQRSFDVVEHRGGPAESGADFLCRFMGPLSIEFAVAVQLKMWTGVAEDKTPLRQLAEAAHSTPISAAVAIITAETTSPAFDEAATELAEDLQIPVRVICREEFMRLVVSSTPTQERKHTAHGT